MAFVPRSRFVAAAGLLLFAPFPTWAQVQAPTQGPAPAPGHAPALPLPVPGAPADAAAATPNPSPAAVPSALATSAAPADQGAYVLGVGDALTVRVFGADDFGEKPVTVEPDGTAALPLVGPVPASGLSVRQFEASLAGLYKRYFKDPEVTVAVTDYRSEPVTILGAVNNPNVIELRGPTRLMQAISLAGGLRADAGSRIVVTRPPAPAPGGASNGNRDAHFLSKEVDLGKIIDGTDPAANVLVQKDDVITVPKAKLVYVVGSVNKPGGYVLDGHANTLSVLRVLALAGGVSSTASTKKARLLSDAPGGDGDQTHVEATINLDKILASKSPDVSLHADDILFVPSSTGKKVGLRALEAAANAGTGLAIYR